MKTSILTCLNRDSISTRAVDFLISQLDQSIRHRGEAHLALTGGSSASGLFACLLDDARAKRIDWTRVHVWQGDERFVPITDKNSNWGAARREWIDHPDGPPIPPDHLHPIPVDEAIKAGHDADWAASRYADEIERLLPKKNGIPAFDVILLGVGTDGHIMSTFPMTDPINEHRRAAMAVPAPTHIAPRVGRVTLAPFLLEAAGTILVMVPGAAKAQIISECFADVDDPSRWPAQLALRPNAVWLLEPDSASALGTLAA